MKLINILWAVKKGDPDWGEVIISNQLTPENMEAAKKWATDNGFDRLRVAKIDLEEKPDFVKTIRPKYITQNLPGLYLEWINDWLTIDAMSEHYDMKIEDMKHLLDKGKIEHLENCCTIAQNKVAILQEAIKEILRNETDNGDIHLMQGSKLKYVLYEALKQTA